jgi:hypothetical protein
MNHRGTMRDVFILENMAACQDFMSAHLTKGYYEDSFLGVGFFSSYLPNDSSTGVKIKVTPHFLEKDLKNYITQGYISLFEQESILIQQQLNIQFLPIKKWLLSGLHSSCFSLTNATILKEINKFKLNTLEDFITTYFSTIIAKINEIRAQIVVLLFDFDIFKNYLHSYLKWSNSNGNNNTLIFKNINQKSLEKTIIYELISFLSNSFFNNKIAIVPSRPEQYNIFLNTIHSIKKDSHIYPDEIIFRV